MKKKFIIAGIIAIVLIFIVLILIVALSSMKPTQYIAMNNITTSAAPVETQNTVANTTPGNKKKSNIKGEIEDYKLEDGNTIPIPPTFSYVEGELDTGVVIEDEDGNQFVWVPVDDFTKYSERFLFDRNGDSSNEELAESLEDTEDYERSYDDSVRNYGGFYIARYEAGKDKETSDVVSKEGTMPWTGVTWEQAKDLAYEMYGEK